MAVEGCVGHGVPLEPQLSWCWQITASLGTSPLHHGPAARPGRRQQASCSRGWWILERPRNSVQAGTSRPIGAWQTAPVPSRRSQRHGSGGLRAHVHGHLRIPNPVQPRRARCSPAAAGPVLLPDGSWPKANGSHHWSGTAPWPQEGQPCPHTTRRALFTAPGCQPTWRTGHGPRPRSCLQPWGNGRG